MMKNKILAIGLLIGSVFLTEANAMQPECLSSCVSSFDGCTKKCNTSGETTLCYISCQGTMDNCFARCGMGQFKELADHAKTLADENKKK